MRYVELKIGIGEIKKCYWFFFYNEKRWLIEYINNRDWIYFKSSCHWGISVKCLGMDVDEGVGKRCMGNVII